MITQFIKAGRRLSRRRAPLKITPNMNDQRFLFIGGLHRSGTSLIHRLLRGHTDTSGFVDTGVPEDEGQHLQTIFDAAYKLGGPGGFAYRTESHLTEHSALATPENRDKLLREWGAWYDYEKYLMLEKSPPNLVRSRFFQSMFPNARFLFIVRHPISVALATRKWNDASFMELLLHWQVAYSILLDDLPFLKHAMVIRYEDIIRSPQHSLDKICELTGLDGFTPQEAIEDRNIDYFKEWARDYSGRFTALDRIFSSPSGPLKEFGYSFDEPYVKEPLGCLLG